MRGCNTSPSPAFAWLRTKNGPRNKRGPLSFTVTLAPRKVGAAGLPHRPYRSPGILSGFTDTDTLVSSAVRMIRVCSTVCAAG